MNKHQMRRRTLFLLLSLFLSVQAAKGSAATYDVLHYDADIQPDLVNHAISGTVVIKLSSLINNLSEIELDANELAIDGVSEGDAAQTFQTDTGRLLVRLSRPAVKGEVRALSIRYHGKPSRGVRFFPDHMYAFYHTSRWLVCHFQPGDKATLSLALTLPANLKVVANGNPIEQKSLSEGSIRHLWRQDMPIPPYIFGFAAGRFAEVSKQAGPVRLHFLTRDNYSQAEVERIFGDTPDMLDFFEKRAGVAYPGTRYTQVLASGSVEQEMDGFTVMRENFGKEMLADPRDNNLAVHEFAHQWWGNSVTCAGWADFWLNEAMAEFMMATYREHRFGRDEYERDLEFARASYTRVRGSGRDRPLAFRHPIKESQAGGSVIYDKGALVLHLLRFELGEKAFWEGIRRYSQKHFGGMVTTSDLQAAMEKASGKSLSAFFTQWVYREGVPRMVARHRVDSGELVVTLEQRQESLWIIPLNVAVETSHGRRNRRITLTSRSQEIRFRLDGDLLSVRVDDGGHLPTRIAHERPLSMLLYQFAHEPDVAGRAGASYELQSVLTSVQSEQTRVLVRAALQERINKDSSRLIRALAQRALEKIGKK